MKEHLIHERTVSQKRTCESQLSELGVHFFKEAILYKVKVKSQANSMLFFFLRFYLFIHETHRERQRQKK